MQNGAYPSDRAGDSGLGRSALRHDLRSSRISLDPTQGSGTWSIRILAVLLGTFMRLKRAWPYYFRGMSYASALLSGWQ